VSWTNADALNYLYRQARLAHGLPEENPYLPGDRMGDLARDVRRQALYRAIERMASPEPPPPPPEPEPCPFNWYHQFDEHCRDRQRYKEQCRTKQVEQMKAAAWGAAALHDLEDSLYPLEEEGEVYQEIEPAYPHKGGIEEFYALSPYRRLHSRKIAA
jgi:hypothetical protein